MSLIDAYVQTTNVDIHYRRTGGQKPPMILIHGFSDSGSCWPLLEEAFAPSYDLIMPDSRAHGLTKTHNAIYNREQFAVDVAGLIDALALDRPILIGHSMGATTAALVAARFPHHVGAVVLEDPAWFPIPEESDADDEAATIGEQADPTAHPFYVWLSDLQAKPTLDEVLVNAKAEHPDWDDRVFAPWAESKRQFDLAALMEFDFPSRVDWENIAPHITCPALLLTGDVEAEALVNPAVAAQAAELMPRGQHVHIAGAGHSIRRDRTAETIAAIRNFLG